MQNYENSSYFCKFFKILLNRPMHKILFICHGNICRSVTAEFVMRDLVMRAGVANQFKIDSAATSREEIGNPIYPNVQRALQAHGICGAKHAARQVTKSDYDQFDMLVLMDEENLRGIRRIIPSDPEGKISLLLDHTDPSDTAHHRRDVADPWYTRDFDQAWEDISIGCQALLRHLLAEC